MKTTVSVVRRPDGGRKGRNGAEVVLLGPQTVDVPSNVPTIHNAPSAIGPYSFAFWWVKDAAGGNFVSLANPVSVSPGTTDMIIKCWYTRTTVAPPAGTGIFVDGFDIDKGSFLDDDFVVVKDAGEQLDAQLTQNANTNGGLSTQATQLIDASASIVFQQFDRWECVRGQETIVGGRVTALQGSNAEAIGIYKKGSSGYSLTDFGKIFAAQTWVSWGVTVDGGGPTGAGPVPPWEPLTRDVAAGLALAQAAGKLHPTLRAEALRVAAKQVSIASKAIAKAIETAAEEATKSKG